MMVVGGGGDGDDDDDGDHDDGIDGGCDCGDGE